MILQPDRRAVLAAFATLPFIAATRAPGVAITVDDFDLTDTPLMSGLQRDEAIRAALAKRGVKAAGFAIGRNVGDAQGAKVLRAWSEQGHILGNHSFSHRRYDGRDPAGAMADILRCEPLLASHAGFRKLYRYPYLAEGDTAEGRDALRALLRANGYRNGQVTIDTSDWFIDGRLTARLKTDPATDLAPYQRFYLDHVWARATFYDDLAKDVFGHSLDHTLLIHHRLTTGLFLDDLLAMFRNRGWRLIDAATAFAAPEFSLEPKILPAGQSLVWAAAKEKGGYEDRLRYPGEDGEYERAQMDALRL